MENKIDRLLGIAQVEKLIGRHRQTIFRWRHSGKFPQPVLIQNRNMWRLSTIQKFIDDSMNGIPYHE